MHIHDIKPHDGAESTDVHVYRPGDVTEDMLHEIAALRLRVWQPYVDKSSNAHRRTLEDWIDAVDHKAYHLTIMDLDDPTKIAGAARLSLHDSLEDIPEPSIPKNFPDWQPDLPYAFFGRLVVEPHDRHHGFAHRLDARRSELAKELGAKMALMLAAPWRQASLEKIGCETIGTIAAEDLGYIDEVGVFLFKRLL
ncbi:MAG: hypothetical protein AAF563_09190 [Pseudomonadota bacterium]